MEIEVYLLRHKATGRLMPQLRGKGYTHWNPGDANKAMKKGKELGTPRIIRDLRSAKIAAAHWFNMPNGKMGQGNSIMGDSDWDIQFIDDGRQRDDLEIVKGRLIIDDVT